MIRADSNAIYAPPGYLLFARDAKLMAQTFDPQQLITRGEPISITEHFEKLSPTINQQVFLMTSSENGILAYHSGDPEKTRLQWFDRTGAQIGEIESDSSNLSPAISPDGTRLAFDGGSSQMSNQDVWLMDLASGIKSQLTTNPATDWIPVWSPDGNRIIFASNRGGYYDLYLKSTDSPSSDELLFESKTNKTPYDWSQDGRYLTFSSSTEKTGDDVWVLPVKGDLEPFSLLQSEANELLCMFSPNGKWIAYSSDESGRPQIYVRSFPVSESKWVVSTQGGYQPKWRRDGQELFYLGPDGKLISAEVKSGRSFEAGVPRPLFRLKTPQAAGQYDRYYAVTPDGQRFLVKSVAEQTNSTAISIVMNWTAMIK
ncbi:MAG: PD40 domain-containing protein [Acidobacteria bacterium]|nr:PD40 domain-containing protein [Acidobacteriota bacterium]